jgi:hypothetical protein
MARLLIEGFESGVNAIPIPWWTNYTSWTVIAIKAGMSGSYCGVIYCTATPYVSLGSSQSEIYVSCKIWVDTLENGAAPLIHFRDSAGTVIACLHRNTSKQVEFRRGGDASTLLKTSTATILWKNTYLLECWYKPLNDGGRCIVKLDGTEILNFDDANGDSTNGLENVLYLGFGKTTGDFFQNVYFDDIVVDNAGWIGNSMIQLVKPTGVGDTAAVWTASAGAPWQCVDEIPYSDSDYISTNATGNVDTYNCNSLTGTIGQVKSLRVLMRYAYEGTPTPTKQKIAIRTGDNYHYGDDLTPTLSYQYAQKLWEINPEDSAAWEEADITDLEIGVASVA